MPNIEVLEVILSFGFLASSLNSLTFSLSSLVLERILLAGFMEFYTTEESEFWESNNFFLRRSSSALASALPASISTI